MYENPHNKTSCYECLYILKNIRFLSLPYHRFFHKAGEHSKALRQLLKAASSSTTAPPSDGSGNLSSVGSAADSEALNLAIEVVGSSGHTFCYDLEPTCTKQ